MKKTLLISRYLLAAVFLFSGFVKGIDPLGTAYKIEDYFIAYHMGWALPFSLIVAFLLIAFEFSLGMLLIFKLLPKFTKWSITLLMVFFTFVTLYDAIYNPVPDCGCFGDALILSNWQTFFKNIVLDILIITLFLYPSQKINLKKQLILGLAIFFAFLSFSYYNLRHLPLIDFRFWKIGTQVFDTEQKPIEMYLTYLNKASGEKQEFLSPNFPYNDSTWLANWEYESTREVNPNDNSSKVMFFDQEGNEVTNEVLGFRGKNLLIIIHDLDVISPKKAKKIRELIQLAEEDGIPISIITSSIGSKIVDFINENGIDIPIFLADDIDLKTIIRSNPGLILLEDGKVENKWAYTDFPISIIEI